MSPEDVTRLAQAFATANGHPSAADWVAKVVDAWKTLSTDTRSDLKQSIADSRRKEE